MINLLEAEQEIKEYFKRHARICEVVDDCANVVRILQGLDQKTCANCSRRQMYQTGYNDGLKAGRIAEKEEYRNICKARREDFND